MLDLALEISYARCDMPIEIERKFLVVGDVWRRLAHKREKLTDGLIAAAEGRKVRVRLHEDRATLAIKGVKNGMARAEFEYEIPVADAMALITEHCGDKVVAKTRHFIAHAGRTWTVDEYEGLLAGIVVAEVELDAAGEEPLLPEWVGREITDDADYRKINLLNARLAERRASDPRLEAQRM